jgi:hypothetical protein
VALNPPLVIANYSMMPLRLFEIDFEDGKAMPPKEHSRIAPKMVDHII